MTDPNQQSSPTKQVGERVRQARLSAGLTQDETVARLAEAGYSITKAGLSKYELSKSTPNATFLLKLGKVLEVPSSYFLQDQQVRVKWGRYRKKSTLSQARRDQIQARALDFVEAMVWLRSRLDIQCSSVFTGRRPAETFELVERAAEWLREQWSLSDLPLESITQLVEDHGGIVVPAEDGDVEFDGLSGWVNEVFPIALVNQSVSPDRRRYSLVHELGHLILDCDDMPDKAQEERANRFAAAFIVPRTAAIRELGSRRRHLNMEELGILKKKYGFSMQAWIYRAKDLNIIDEGHCRSLWIEFSRRGWKRAEPVQYQGDETPSQLRRLTLRAFSEGLIGTDQAERLSPGCLESQERTAGGMSADQLLRLSPYERAQALEAAAADVAVFYNSSMEDF